MTHSLTLDGKEIPLTLRWHARAKRLILKMDPKGNGVIVTLPKGAPAQSGLEMAQRHQVWIANQLMRQPDVIAFKDGQRIDFQGRPYWLKHLPDARGTVWCEGDSIFVAGKAEFFERRLCDWLKKQAKSIIESQAHDMAAKLGKDVKRISVRDTVSRWGSCSSRGNLSFNWRLVLAPPNILTYVIAHEVSHLRHMDHSADFWATVETFHVDVKKSRRWLKTHGQLLQSYGGTS